MKQVLITCDSCGKVSPGESVRKWWGLANTGGNVPDMKFTPVRPDSVEQFKSHACGEECLAKMLMAFAQSVDMKKVVMATAPSAQSFYNIFGSMMFGGAGSDTSDSIKYYKKPELENDDDDDEDDA